MKKFPGVLVLMAALFAFAAPASAQFQIGGGLGYLFDREEDFLLIHGDARIDLSGSPFVINPKLTYFLGDGTMWQIDGNLLYNLLLADASRFHPYVGAGVGINRFSFDTNVPGGEDFSETTVGLNLVHGTRITMNNSPLELFGHLQYFFANDFQNQMILYAGVLVRVGGGGQ